MDRGDIGEIGRQPEDLRAVMAESATHRESAQAAIRGNLSEVEILAKGGSRRGPVVARSKLHRLLKDAVVAENTFNEEAERLSTPYVVSPELRENFRIARMLSKPLLLEGGPGSGKTGFAYALAAEEGLDLIKCSGNSRLTAESVLYEVDHVRRMADVSLAVELPPAMREEAIKWKNYLMEGNDPANLDFERFIESMDRVARLMNIDRVADIHNYVQFGELGEAIMRAATGERVVLLIDEIDKTKPGFDDDLLDQLEHRTMTIRETGEVVTAPKENLIIVITSNGERELSGALRRRCVFDYLEFPTSDMMAEIIKLHVPDVSQGLLNQAIETVNALRQGQGLEHAASTAEVVDWVKALMVFGVREIKGGVPLVAALLKTKDDQDLAIEVLGEERSALQEKELSEKMMAAEFAAAFSGQKVFTMDLATDPYSDAYERTKEVYLTLANTGIPFTTPLAYGSKFEINAPGIRSVGGAFAVTSPEGMKVYRILADNGYVTREIVITSKPIQLAEVDESNELYLRGKDSEGREIYRLPNGVSAHWQEHGVKAEDEEFDRGQMEEALYRAQEEAEKANKKKVL